MAQMNGVLSAKISPEMQSFGDNGTLISPRIYVGLQRKVLCLNIALKTPNEITIHVVLCTCA
jgi:hypothetical protein